MIKRKLNEVWIVERGTYSDYHVIGIFSSRENAKKVSKLIWNSNIAKRTLDPCMNEINKGMNQYLVW